MLAAKDYIEHYHLTPHPEGGFYKENYRSNLVLKQHSLPETFTGNRNVSTAIFFLLEQGNFSAFHKIISDECWHFYAGQTLKVHIIYPNGVLETILLGNNTILGEQFQFVVPANCWFASEPAESTTFSFVGCTVAPGFDFDDFELAKAAHLMQLYPEHETIIKRLCRC